MSIQPISNPSTKPVTKSFILPKVQWVGRQILVLGKTVYSQLAKVTNLFYQTIKTHPKKTLAILTGSTITLLIYYKGKSVSSFLKSGAQEKILQQQIHELSQQVSENLEELQKQFTLLDGNIKVISKSQKTIQNRCTQIEEKYEQLKNDFGLSVEPIPQSASSKEKIASLEIHIQNLQGFKPRLQELIEETDTYKNNLSHSQNPFNS
ncbi:MAG: hypothetical protein ACRCU0_02995 [Candidatus Rhabdochlamydia sp.]